MPGSPTNPNTAGFAPTASRAQFLYLLEALFRLRVRDPERLARECGVEPGLDHDSSRVPAAVIGCMLAAAGRELGDPLVGLRAGSAVESRGPLPYVMALSPSLQDGLEAVTRLTAVVYDMLSLEVVSGPRTIDLEVGFRGPAGDDATFVDYVVAVTIGKLRRALPQVVPVGVSLAHGEVGPGGEAARVLGYPVTFGAKRNAIHYPTTEGRTKPSSETARVLDMLRVAGRALLGRTSESALDSFAVLPQGDSSTSIVARPMAPPPARSKAAWKGVIGSSPAWRRVVELVEHVATSGVPVLLLGETGVGKERVAEAVHALSPRAERPLVRVNCASLPEALAEAELFGRERGAYTGADRTELGRFEVADGSTLFLDEIGEMPLELQSKLLRVLEDGSFERLGSPRTRRADVRIVAATNRDLEEEMQLGRFRRDLWFRLAVFPITIPPLRDRGEDVLLLADDLARQIAESMGRPFDGFDAATVARFRRHDWPGNVRELRNVLQRALVLADGPVLSVEVGHDSGGDGPVRPIDAKMREFIVSALERCGWRVRGEGGAAETLGLPPSTLESRMKKLGIRRPGRGSTD